MAMVGSLRWHEDFGIDPSGYPGFFTRTDDLLGDLSHTSALCEAFDALELDGILCTDNAPLIYFKNVDEIQPQDAMRIHRRFWNLGGAPILVLIAPQEVHIYSGLARPESIDSLFPKPSCLVETLDRVAPALQNFLVSAQSGAYFLEHTQSFDPDSRVDQDLLVNLGSTRERLRKETQSDSSRDVVDRLLCRVVFSCYLFDREIIGANYLSELDIEDCNHLRDVLSIEPRDMAISMLYRFFRALGDDFNGDLFGNDLAEEERYIDEAHIRALSDFLHGTNVRTGQRQFWPYDFRYIPIETISAIYERFITNEDQRKGTFYTPRFLAEIVLDTALEGFGPLVGKTYLDPACGSGIFLVGLFVRIAVEWTKANPEADNETRSRELMALLRTSVYGVDTSVTACRIAAFSLYLAYLDQLSPRDIQDLQRRGNVLPHLVDDRTSSGSASTGRDGRATGNIICADFFSVQSDIPTDAQLVIGNPPWTSSASEDTDAGRWCADNEKRIPDKQLAAAFVWKAPYHVRDGGRICFVLPHGTLFNHSGRALEFQRRWVARHRIERVMNLADFRFCMFRDAVHPALVVRYREAIPDLENDRIEYWAPKADWGSASAQFISVGSSDRTNLSLREVWKDLHSADAPQIWKRHFWATARDLRLVDRLRDFPRLRDHVRASSEESVTKRWVRADGFQPVGPSDDVKVAKRLELPTTTFIPGESGAFRLFLLPEDCQHLHSKTVTVRQRSNTNTDVFRAPHVLFSHGLGRVAYADFDVCFRQSIRGIHGPPGDRSMLIFLSAYLRSQLARYFVFHTSSNWGVYRPKVHVEEIGRLPLPLPTQLENPTRAREIVDRVVEIVESAYRKSVSSFLHRTTVTDEASDIIEDLIDEYFDITPDEKLLIVDTINVVLPSLQPKSKNVDIPTLIRANDIQLTEYTSRVCTTLDRLASGSEYTVRGSSVVSHDLGIGAVTLEKVRRSVDSVDIPTLEDGLLHVFRSIVDHSVVRHGTVRPMRGVMVFEGNRLHILKSAAQVDWTPTAALNDAETLAGTLLTYPSMGSS